MNGAKKLLCAAAAAAALFLVLRWAGAAPGSYLLLGGSERFGGAAWEMSYYRFSGEKNRSIRLGAGEALTVSLQAQTEGGALTILLLEEGEERGRLWDDGTTGARRSISLTAEQDMRLTLRAEGEDHRGGFAVTWEKTALPGP